MSNATASLNAHLGGANVKRKSKCEHAPGRSSSAPRPRPRPPAHRSPAPWASSPPGRPPSSIRPTPRSCTPRGGATWTAGGWSTARKIRALVPAFFSTNFWFHLAEKFRVTMVNWPRLIIFFKNKVFGNNLRCLFHPAQLHDSGRSTWTTGGWVNCTEW
jgi:hypothetical protein